MQVHTKDGVREATPEEIAKIPISAIEKLLIYAESKGWI